MAYQLKDREAYQRLNYLHQAAHCVLSQNPENVELARFYSFTQRTVARRLVLRQDPSVKRTICKKCFSLLIPGVTATTRQQRKKRKTRFTVVTCLSCGQSKKFLNNPDYCLWVDNPKAQMDQQKPPDSGHSAQHQTKKDKKADGSQASKSSATQSKDGT